MKKLIIPIILMMILLVGCGFVKSEDEIKEDLCNEDINMTDYDHLWSVKIDKYAVKGDHATANITTEGCNFDPLTLTNKVTSEQHVVTYEKRDIWVLISFE